MVARSAGKVDPQLCSVADHEALKLDAAAWASLKLKGYQYTPVDEDGPEEVLELRDCGCGSTLAITISPATYRVMKESQMKAPRPPIGSYIHGHYSAYKVVGHIGDRTLRVVSPMDIKLDIEWDTELQPASSWRVETR